MKTVFTISLPIHLYEFALRDIFEGQSAPFKVTERSALGKFIMGILNDKRPLPLGYYTGYDGPENNERTLALELSTTLAERSPNQVKLRGIEYFLDNLFKEKLKTWCRAKMLSGDKSQNKRRSAAVLYFQYYGLPTTTKVFDTNYQYLTSKVPRITSSGNENKEG